MEEYYSLSNAECVAVLGARFRDYRIAMRHTQQEVATRAGVSLPTVRHFEQGRATNLSLSTLLALLRIVGLLQNIEQLLPPLPQDPSLVFKQQTKTIKRVRK